MIVNDSSNKQGFTLIEVIITLVIVAIVGAMMASYFGTSITQSSLPLSRLSNSAKLNQIMEKITFEYNNLPPTWRPDTAFAAGTVILPRTANRNGYQYYCAAGVTSGATEPVWPLSTCTGSSCTVSGFSYNGTAPPKNWVAGTAYAVNAIVYPPNGYQYICLTAGTSGDTPPNWGTDSSWTGYDTTAAVNQVRWAYRGIQPLVVLKNSVDTNSTTDYYGAPYTVVANRFIKFSGSGTNYTEDTASGALAPGNTDYRKYLKVIIGLSTGEQLTTLFVRR